MRSIALIGLGCSSPISFNQRVGFGFWFLVFGLWIETKRSTIASRVTDNGFRVLRERDA